MNFLTQISDINNIIRDNSSLAKSLRVTALNAMLRARRATGKSAGFARVTAELRTFSGDLNKTMNDILTQNNALIRHIAILTATQHQTNIMEKALSSSQLKSATTQYILERTLNNQHNISKQVKYTQQKFAQLIKRLNAVCKRGESLAVLTTVETQGVTSNSNDLIHISVHITKTVEALATTAFQIGKMNKRLLEQINSTISSTETSTEYVSAA